MTIYYYDTAAPTRDWFSLRQGDVVPVACSLPLGGNAFQVDAIPIASPSCVVMHDSIFDAQHKWTILTSLCATTPNIAFILVSGGEIQTPPIIPTNLCVYRAAVANGAAFLNDSFVLRFKRWYARARQSADLTFDWSEFDLEQGHALALKLLCEAYTMHPSGEGEKKYPSQVAGGVEISFHCPDPGTWFELIGASKPNGDEKQKKAEIASLGRLMGGAGDAAMDLARAIVQPNSDISDAAGKFVEKVSEITAAQVGGAQ